MTPLVSAHDDVCTLAADNKASLIIIPFHKQWKSDGVTESSEFRNINKNVLNKAPCSVGILIDRGRLNHVSKSVATRWSTYNIGVIFLGDTDDREALYYAMQMAGHPNVSLIVHRLVLVKVTLHDLNENILDGNLIEYRLHNMDREGHQEVVKDGFEIASAVRALETSYDLGDAKIITRPSFLNSLNGRNIHNLDYLVASSNFKETFQYWLCNNTLLC